jgi:hypothetical protein
MSSSEINDLEKQLAKARAMVEQDELAIAGSSRPQVERVYLSSSRKLRADLQQRLMLAKAERAYEVLRVRLHATQFSTGTIPLRAMTKIVNALNGVLEQSAWRVWDKTGEADRLDEKFVRLIDLRLAGIQSGSTELVVLGNTSPDLTGESALESGLRNVFELLSSGNDEIADTLNIVGTSASKNVVSLMSSLEQEKVATEIEWSAPDQVYRWDGRPQEITRIRTLLEEIGDPSVEIETFTGVVHVLSVRNRIEIFRPDTGKRIRATYHRSLNDEIHELRLDDVREFVVERTTYPFATKKHTRDAFRLMALNDARARAKLS